MKIQSIVFNNNYLRSFISLIYSKIFKRVNLYFFANLQKINFEYNFKLHPTSVLVKTIQCGYCGTDRKIVTYDFSINSSALLDTQKHKVKSMYLGHEVVGKIIELGHNVKGLKINDIVIVDSVNRKNSVDNKDIFGGFTNFFVKDQKKLIKIEGKLKSEQAILIEPLACGLEAIKKTIIKKNDKILIIGAGIIGSGIAHLLRYYYKEHIDITIATNSFSHKKMLSYKTVDNIIYKKDLFDESKKLLKSGSRSIMNNKILLNGYNKVFECSGDLNIFNTILRICKKDAHIVLTGMNMKNIQFDPTPIWHRNLKISGAHGYKKKYPKFKLDTLAYISQLILKKKTDLSKLKIKKIYLKNWKDLFKENNQEYLKKSIFFK